MRIYDGINKKKMENKELTVMQKEKRHNRTFFRHIHYYLLQVAYVTGKHEIIFKIEKIDFLSKNL